MKNYLINIKDYFGNVLIEEACCDSKEVNDFLERNKCQCTIDDSNICNSCSAYGGCKNCEKYEKCEICEGTGYKTEFYAEWCDEDNEENIYEWINY